MNKLYKSGYVKKGGYFFKIKQNSIDTIKHMSYYNYEML